MIHAERGGQEERASRTIAGARIINPAGARDAAAFKALKKGKEFDALNALQMKRY
jgi:hypothetical protein